MSHTPRLALITEAVVAQYIHEISERHQAPEPEASEPEETRSVAGPGLDDAHRLAA